MKAAVVSSFDSPPQFGEFAEPVPLDGEQLVQVKAAALSPLTKGQASGSHYSSSGEGLPLVPGSDGVGRLEDGTRVYFIASRKPFGTMAELSLASKSGLVLIPNDLDDVTAAAMANPGMSSFAALTTQAQISYGDTVLVHGATGSAGRLATKIAKHLGAGRVIATGRGFEALERVSADERILLDRSDEELTADYKRVFADGGVQIVLDYLWGAPTSLLLKSLVGKGSPAGEPHVRYVQIGSVAGGTIEFPAQILRSTGLRMMGSGLGSVPIKDLLASISGVFGAAKSAGLQVEVAEAPLSEVGEAWNRDTEGRRLVFRIGS